MRAEDLLKALQRGTVRFSGITHDSRKVQPGFLFAAVPGKEHDGHAYIRDAMYKQATCIVSEHPCLANIPVFITDSVRKWLGPLSAAVYQNPSYKLKITGITGSNGKTTIASMIHSFFVAQGESCGLIGTVENEINGVRSPATLTTPEAPDLQKMLFDLTEAGTRHAVMEVSAQGVEMGRIEGTQFSIGIFTNLTVDHLDFHTDLESYLACKKRFMQKLGPEQIGIFNWDDPYVRQTIEECDCRVFTYSIFDQEADLSVRDLNVDAAGSHFRLKMSPRLQKFARRWLDSLPFQVQLPGLHNVSNSLAALLAGILLNLDPLALRRALSQFRPVTRRMQTAIWEGVTVVDDTAMNPGSIQAVLDSFALQDYTQIQVAFAIRGNRGIDVNRENAEILQKWYKRWAHLLPKLVITSSVNHVGKNDKVHCQEETVFLETLKRNDVPYSFYTQLPDAIEHVSQACTPRGILFLLGAQGMDDGFGILSQTRKIKDLVNGQPLC